MTFSKTVNLHAVKTPGRRLTLDYLDEPVGLKQARLAGRRTLAPAINLNDYTCRAVMDWVSITFDLRHQTQFRYVQDALTPLIGRRPLVVPSSPEPGGVATVFTVTFQEPHLATLRDCHEVLKAEFGEVSEPFVNDLEVSVDFTPRMPSDDSRGRMVAVLGRHLHSGRDVLKRSTIRPRFSWGSKRSQNSFTLKRSSFKLDDNDMLLNTAGDAVPPIDATYYIGHRRVGALWRVMDKVIDRQNRDAGTWVELPDDEKRSRVEVRLDRLELKGLGVKSLDDLLQLNFAQLQGRYFKFMLPTFMALAESEALEDRYVERERIERFLNVGVVGLQGMDDQRRKERLKHRPALVGHLRAKNVPAPVVDRRGRGPAGSLVAYKIVNDRVAMALRKLVERERRMLG